MLLRSSSSERAMLWPSTVEGDQERAQEHGEEDATKGIREELQEENARLLQELASARGILQQLAPLANALQLAEVSNALQQLAALPDALQQQDAPPPPPPGQ